MIATEPSLFLLILPLHVAFFLSFALPALYLALAGGRRPLRRNRVPLGLGIGFAVPTIVLSLLLSGASDFWYIYPAIYALVVVVPAGVRLAAAPALKVLEEETPDEQATVELSRAMTPEPAEKKEQLCCRSSLIASSGSRDSDFRRGKAGTKWLPGSNYYEWTLSVKVLAATDNGLYVIASARGYYIPWYGVSARPVDLSNSITATVFCRDWEGKCAARGSGGEIQPTGDVYEIAISVAAVPGPAPDEVTLDVDAVASVEGNPLIEKIELSGAAGGSLGPVKAEGKLGTTIRVANDAKAKALLSRNYNYRCVPCENEASPLG